MKHHYHITQQLTLEEAAEYERAAKTQDGKVLRYFQKNPGRHLSAEMIQEIGILPPDTPLTSFRRSLTNLANPLKNPKILLVGQAIGKYGRPVNLYKLL
jgi:hypothetical protein